MVRNAIESCYRGCPNAEAVAGKIAFNPHGRENLLQPIRETEVDHLQEGTRGKPDQYGCGNLCGTDPFLMLLS